MRYLTLLVMTALAALGALATAVPAQAANPAHLRDVLYADGVVTLQLTEPTHYKTTFWKSEKRFIVDVDASGVDLLITRLPVNTPRLDAVRWKLRQPGSVRIVLDLNDTNQPTVLASPPTNIIAIRVAASGSRDAAVRPTDQTSPIQPSQPVERTPEKAPERTPDAPPIMSPEPSGSQGPPAQIGDIEVVRGGDGRPERVIVRTNRAVTVRATWWNNRLAVDLPEAARTAERIVPINDPVLLRVRTGTFEGHGRVVLDTTQRIGYKLSTLEDGRGFVLDCFLPTPTSPAPEVEPVEEIPVDAPIGDSLRGRLIVLDPGHGDFDKGARSQWATEKEANLDIALRLRRVLESVGARVEMTRTDDTFVPLRQRPALAMRLQADAFISIHHNSSVRPTNAGTEVFYRRGDGESKRLASALYRAHRATTGLKGRGVKSDSNAPQGGLAVLKNTTVPNALVEIAFLNNPAEGRKVADPDWRQQVAVGLAKGLARFMEGQD